MKSAIPLFLAGLLLAAPAAVRAQFTYITNADGATLTITGCTTNYVPDIPSTINGMLVTGLGNNAFNYMAIHGSVTIPGSITNTGSAVFAYCGGTLYSVTMEYGVTTIGVFEFENSGTLSSVTIPNSVTNIGAGAFNGCTSLSSITIPNSVTSIGDGAFEICPLSNVILPTNISNIGNGVFDGCDGLINISIPATVTNIGESAFFGCMHLPSVIIPSNVVTIGESAFGMCIGLSNVTISSGVTSIGANAFNSDNSLTSLDLPGSITNIGASAFAQCGLANITIPAGVTSIGSDAFSFSALTNVFFVGNAPVIDPGTLTAYSISYYLPGTIGWSNTFGGRPAVLWNPVIQTANGNFGISNHQFGFNITSTNNLPIVVEVCSNLANPVWTPLTNVFLTNGLFHFSEPLQTNSAARFYGLGFP